MFNMQIQIYLLIVQYIFFCSLFIFSGGKTLIGENVRPAIDGDFPNVVSLSLIHPNQTNITKHYCTGTLVSNRDVLTAAHCLTHKNKTRTKVIVGSVDTRLGRKHSVLWWITYKQWTINNNLTRMFRHNDVALVRLRSNASSTIEPGELTNLRNPQLVGHAVDIAGWGRREDNRYPWILHTAEVIVIDINECRYRVGQLLRERYFIDINFFCSLATPYVLGHRGDSGSPIFLFGQIVGINVGTIPFSNTSFHPGKVNANIGIFNYRNFIYDVIQNGH